MINTPKITSSLLQGRRESGKFPREMVLKLDLGCDVLRDLTPGDAMSLVYHPDRTIDRILYII
jgi:hypothetical protein